MTPYEIQVDHDYNRAKDYAMKYGLRFVLEVQARAAVIELAAEKYAKFLDLPAKSGKVLAVLDLIWSGASTIVPILRFAKIAETAELGLRLAKVANMKASTVARVVVNAGKVHDGVKTGSEVGGTAKGLAEKADAIVAAQPDGMAELAKLDVRKAPIRDLMKDARQVLWVWGQMLDLLTDIRAMRFARPNPNGESMLHMVQKALPEFQAYTDEELDQLELSYLWLMIGRYVSTDVVIVTDAVNGKDSIEGLNNTQRETIRTLFGLGVPRGRYFVQPVFFHTQEFLYHWQAKQRTNNRERVGQRR